MNEDYLWDRSGEPDPEIERLEKLLSPFRYPERPARRWRPFVLAAVGTLAAASVAIAVWMHQGAMKTSWQAVRMQANGEAVGAPTDIYTGQRIQTDATSRVQVRSDMVGQVDLDPNSELYVKESRETRHIMSLHRGTLHALIWAPPSQFAVDTPSVRAVDLGCAYTLETQPDGDGLITVQRGWVAFDTSHKESFIPAQAACRVYAQRGPGIPWFEDAGPAFRSALQKWEQQPGEGSLETILESARPRDGLTLWHLLTRVQPGERGEVYDRLKALVRLPAEARKESVVAGSRPALDLCWNALDLGDTSWWRTWKQAW